MILRVIEPVCRCGSSALFGFFFFKQKTAYDISLGLVGSELCIRDRTILEQYTSCLVMLEYRVNIRIEMNNTHIEGSICKWTKKYPTSKQAHIHFYVLKSTTKKGKMELTIFQTIKLMLGRGTFIY